MILDLDNVPLYWSVFMADTNQSYYCEGGPRFMHIYYMTKKAGISHGVVANILDCDLEVSE